MKDLYLCTYRANWAWANFVIHYRNNSVVVVLSWESGWVRERGGNLTPIPAFPIFFECEVLESKGKVPY